VLLRCSLSLYFTRAREEPLCQYVLTNSPGAFHPRARGTPGGTLPACPSPTRISSCAMSTANNAPSAEQRKNPFAKIGARPAATISCKPGHTANPVGPHARATATSLTRKSGLCFCSVSTTLHSETCTSSIFANAGAAWGDRSGRQEIRILAVKPACPRDRQRRPGRDCGVGWVFTRDVVQAQTESFVETVLQNQNHKALASHAVDFDPPIYIDIVYSCT